MLTCEEELAITSLFNPLICTQMICSILQSLIIVCITIRQHLTYCNSGVKYKCSGMSACVHHNLPPCSAKHKTTFKKVVLPAASVLPTHFILASMLTVLVNVSCLAIALKCLQLSDKSLVVFSRPSVNSDKST